MQWLSLTSVPAHRSPADRSDGPGRSPPSKYYVGISPTYGSKLARRVAKMSQKEEKKNKKYKGTRKNCYPAVADTLLAVDRSCAVRPLFCAPICTLVFVGFAKRGFLASLNQSIPAIAATIFFVAIRLANRKYVGLWLPTILRSK